LFNSIYVTPSHTNPLVVGVQLKPSLDPLDLSSGVVNSLRRSGAHQVLPNLVVGEDEHAPRDSGKPVGEPDVPRSQRSVEEGHVAQVSSQQGLEEESEVHDAVAQSLGPQAQPPRLADEQIGPLHDDDADEVTSLGVVERLLLGRPGRNVEADLVPGGGLTGPAAGGVGAVLAPLGQVGGGVEVIAGGVFSDSCASEARLCAFLRN